MTDTAHLEQHEEAVVTALLSGRTVRSVRREFNLTIDQIDAIIARTWPVDNRARVRMIMTDLGLLDRLIGEFYKRALGSQDVTSAAFATVALKALERKHALTGVEAATRIDLQVSSDPVEAPSSFEKVHSMILEIARKGRDGNGQAPPGGDSDGDVSVLSPPDDQEPSN